MKISEVNHLSSDLFIDNFKNIFEKTSSIAIFSEKKRPFMDKQHIINIFMKEFDNLSTKEKKYVIRNHPDLGLKLKKYNNLTNISQNEQKNAGLDKCTEDEYNSFERMNNEFKLKFDIPFIYAVKGANKTMILNEFKKRLNNSDLSVELEESFRQVKKIAFLRLDEFIDE